jgi:Undecaprenyl-phosphate galactose phosphotransferase WbaP
MDILALELALGAGLLTRTTFHVLFLLRLNLSEYAGPAIGILLLPLTYYCMSLYPGFGLGAVHRLRGRVYATLSTFAALLVWNSLFQHSRAVQGVLLYTLPFALVLPSVSQTILRKMLVRTGLGGAPVVILGAGETAAQVVNKLKNDSSHGLRPIAILDDNSSKWGKSLSGVTICGPLSQIDQFRGKAEIALVAMPERNRDDLVALVQRLSFPNIIVVPDLRGLQTLWTTSRDLGGILGLELRKNLLLPQNRFRKRVLDYVVAAPALLLSLPLIFVCAIWIKLVSPGPAFFRQEREGEEGKRINVWKLRTMHVGAEKLLMEYLNAHPEENATWQRYFKLKKDPRVIPGIGWFLRVASLDELPQLWNVLNGDMSIVGPRPFPYYHLNSFSTSFRQLRRSIAPGLTGLWQVSERSDGDLGVQEAQDTYYIRNWSLWLDIYILLRTIRIVIFPKGAY